MENDTVFELSDQMGGTGKQKVSVIMRGGGLFLQPEGYGDYYSFDGSGFPLLVELYEGKLRVVVWDDINKEYPRIISLEKAKESNRQTDEE